MLPPPNDLDKLGLATALAKARKSYQEGGIPIGATLVFHGSASCGDGDGNGDVAAAAVLGCAHNQRIQTSSPTLHAEMAALEDAGRLRADVYRRSTMVCSLFRPSVLTRVLWTDGGGTQYTTLSPCIMCTGAILLYKIPRVVIGENVNLVGAEDLLKQRGVEVVVLDDPECKALLARYIKEHPEDWNEDIGE
ncbi:cytidine deaminase-like protein [Boletus coccyginus]|nr:cytidine deaminase-like protein [Boletus coccyginus]